MLKNKKLTNKKSILILTAVVLIAASVGAYFAFIKKDSQTGSNTPGVVDSGINMEPATDVEKQETEQHKKDIEAANNNKPASGSGKKQVTPVVTYASQNGQTVTINAFVSGVVEDGGTCMAVFTRGNLRVTKTSQAFANANSTNCAPTFIDSSEFSSKGVWELTLSYSSATASGVAQPQAVSIE